MSANGKSASGSGFNKRRRNLLLGVVCLPLVARSLPAPASLLLPHPGRYPISALPLTEVPGIRPGEPPAFTEAEISAITRLVETMIPSDDTAGAREAGTAAFVVASLTDRGPESVTEIRQGLDALDHMAWIQFRRRFIHLDDTQTAALLETVHGTPEFAAFWHAIRSLAVLHFFSTPAGYVPLGLPGPTLDRGGFPTPGKTACLSRLP